MAKKVAEKKPAKSTNVATKTKDTKPTKATPKASEKKSAVKETNTAKVVEPVNPVVKTASKKTKKDLALHELLIQHALQMANLKSNQCRWPIGDPDSDNCSPRCGK